MIPTDLKKVCAQELAKLLPSITAKDRKEAEEKIPISRPTLDKYLAGKIVKIDTAINIIKFFTNKANQHLEELKQRNPVNC
jgi:hypothetical protein